MIGILRKLLLRELKKLNKIPLKSVSVKLEYRIYILSATLNAITRELKLIEIQHRSDMKYIIYYLVRERKMHIKKSL